MAMVPLYKPANPCIADLNGMFVAKTIYICGKIHKNPTRIDINLLYGLEDTFGIALHVNPRFTENRIVRNTRTYEVDWGKPETGGTDLPLTPGQVFGISITCRADGYEIKANGFTPYATFKHRIPFHFVSHVEIKVDCDIILVASMIEGLDVPLHVVSNPQEQVEIPFHNIRERTVVIVGKPTNGNGRFTFDFINPANKVIHFHFNPRLNEKKIVRNSKNDGWGAEEKELGMAFPFVEGASFQVAVTVEEQQFVVKIDGSQAFTYQRRVDCLEDIRRIAFHEDVEIETVTFY